ncbi:hypothetical protein A7K94_0200805 [Modestobacter sp. VKM Ac-2676]|nr:hypothetical protein A7K94_0200805 [Modestobacter sp. VKM Ac-2676]
MVVLLLVLGCWLALAIAMLPFAAALGRAARWQDDQRAAQLRAARRRRLQPRGSRVSSIHRAA